jgi:predicted membrane protein
MKVNVKFMSINVVTSMISVELGLSNSFRIHHLINILSVVSVKSTLKLSFMSG